MAINALQVHPKIPVIIKILVCSASTKVSILHPYKGSVLVAKVISQANFCVLEFPSHVKTKASEILTMLQLELGQARTDILRAIEYL